MRLAKLLFVVVALCAFGVACGEGSGDDPQPDAMMCGMTELYESCATGDDCTSCLCFNFNMAGQLCTQSCAGDEDCPAPSDGCNGMGVCKRPGG